MDQTLLFIPFSKVDEEKQEVWGLAASEAPDHDGEIFDYLSSKPEIEAWSENAYKTSGGQSYGNLRAMHQKIAAGKLIKIEFNDGAKQVMVGTKVVDSNEWAKVLQNVYTGFSFGGSYKKRWTDPANPLLKRYTASPTELSLADKPCNPEAVFEFVKADGTSEMRKFAKVIEVKPPVEAPKLTKNSIILESENMLTSFASAISQLTTLHKMEKFKKLAGGKAIKSTEASQVILKTLLGKVAAGSTAELKKGMYGVGELARAIANIDCITTMEEYEAAAEGDGSTIPTQLAAVRSTLGQILVAMATEEAAELSPAATAAPLDGVDDMELTDAQKLAKAQGIMLELLAALPTMDKAAKVSAKDAVQAIHDSAVKLGATHNDLHDGEAGYKGGDTAGDEGGKDGKTTTKEDAEKLAKLTADNAAMAERLTKLEGLPAAGAAPASTDLSKLAGQLQNGAPAGGNGQLGTPQGIASNAEVLAMIKTASDSASPVSLEKLTTGKGNLALLNK